MRTKWIDIRKKIPADGQRCFFVRTDGGEVLVGSFDSPQKIDHDGLIGSFRTADRIGYNVWRQNRHEVTHWSPVVLPKGPKKTK